MSNQNIKVVPASVGATNVRIYEFGARLDGDTEPRVLDEITKARRLYNNLVEVMQITVRDMRKFTLTPRLARIHLAFWVTAPFIVPAAIGVLAFTHGQDGLLWFIAIVLLFAASIMVFNTWLIHHPLASGEFAELVSIVEQSRPAKLTLCRWVEAGHPLLLRDKLRMEKTINRYRQKAHDERIRLYGEPIGTLKLDEKDALALSKVTSWGDEA